MNRTHTHTSQIIKYTSIIIFFLKQIAIVRLKGNVGTTFRFPRDPFRITNKTDISILQKQQSRKYANKLHRVWPLSPKKIRPAVIQFRVDENVTYPRASPPPYTIPTTQWAARIGVVHNSRRSKTLVKYQNYCSFSRKRFSKRNVPEIAVKYRLVWLKSLGELSHLRVFLFSKERNIS